MHSEFSESLQANQALFGIELPQEAVARLSAYYGLILEHNEFFNLVGPCSPAEFATRHILESLTMLEHLERGARFADVGSGGGLPAVPCLLVRDDLRAVLIESKEKKAQFLNAACEALDLTARLVVTNKQFAETDIAGCRAVSCRALDKFTERLPRLLRWADPRQLLFFGGPNLRDALTAQRLKFGERLMPLSEQRYLFVVNP